MTTKPKHFRMDNSRVTKPTTGVLPAATETPRKATGYSPLRPHYFSVLPATHRLTCAFDRIHTAPMTQLTLFPESREREPFAGRVYFMTDGVRIKIGYTERPPKRRGGELKTEVIYDMAGDELAERREHARWSASRIGRTEWFEADHAILVWLARRATDANAVRALEWLAHNLDRRPTTGPAEERLAG